MAEQAGDRVDQDKQGGDAGHFTHPRPTKQDHQWTEEDPATDPDQA